MPWKQHASGWCSGGIRISDPDTGALPFFDGTEWTGKSLPEIIDETARPLKADRLHGDPVCGIIKWDDQQEKFTNVEIKGRNGVTVNNGTGCGEGDPSPMVELDVGEGCGLLVRTTNGDLVLRELVEGNGIAITNEDGCDGNPTIGRKTAGGSWQVVSHSQLFPTLYTSLSPVAVKDPILFRSLFMRSDYVGHEEESPFEVIASPQGVTLNETTGVLTVAEGGLYQLDFSMIVFAPSGPNRISGVYVVVNGAISPPVFSRVFVHTAGAVAFHEVRAVTYLAPSDELRVMAHDLSPQTEDAVYAYSFESNEEFPINITPRFSLFRVG